MPRDILIVDDVKIALENFGNEVRMNLNIEPFLTNDPMEAIKIIRDYPIKVLVTDQEMPIMSGTDLVRKVKEDLGKNIPCIMLTGYTNKVSVVEAVNLGFFRFIDKINTHSELTQAIREGIRKFDIEASRHGTIVVDSILSKKRKLLSINDLVQVKIIRISSIIDPFIYERDWQTYHVAQRNIKTIEEVTVKRRVKAGCNIEEYSEILSKSKLDVKQLIFTVEGALDGKTGSKISSAYEEEIDVTMKRTLEVLSIDDVMNQDGFRLQSREYQTAPVYIRAICLLEIDCTCCGIINSIDVTVDIPTPRIALRQIEHFDRGPNRTIYTGFFGGSLEVS